MFSYALTVDNCDTILRISNNPKRLLNFALFEPYAGYMTIVGYGRERVEKRGESDINTMSLMKVTIDEDIGQGTEILSIPIRDITVDVVADFRDRVLDLELGNIPEGSEFYLLDPGRSGRTPALTMDRTILDEEYDHWCRLDKDIMDF